MYLGLLMYHFNVVFSASLACSGFLCWLKPRLIKRVFKIIFYWSLLSNFIVLCSENGPLSNSYKVIKSEWPQKFKWALGSISMHKASGDDGISADLFKIIKDYVVKVLHSVCQQIWKTQQWAQDWKRSVFIPTPKKWSHAVMSDSLQCHGL